MNCFKIHLSGFEFRMLGSWLKAKIKRSWRRLETYRDIKRQRERERERDIYIYIYICR